MKDVPCLARPGLRVLMYHRVNDALPPGALVVGTRRFREQMRWLKEHCEVVALLRWSQAAFRAEVCRGKSERPVVALTFDDGYRDNFLNAFPVLKECSAPATVFLITSYVGTNRSRPRYAYMAPPDMLRWEEVEEMARAGVSFGAHTATHPHLSRLSPPERRREIAESVRALREHLAMSGGKPREFSYPYGEWDEEMLAMVRQEGLDVAVTLDPGTNDEMTSLLRLRRTEINGAESLEEFRQRLCGACDDRSAFRPQ